MFIEIKGVCLLYWMPKQNSRNVRTAVVISTKLFLLNLAYCNSYLVETIWDAFELNSHSDLYSKFDSCAILFLDWRKCLLKKE